MQNKQDLIKSIKSIKKDISREIGIALRLKQAWEAQARKYVFSSYQAEAERAQKKWEQLKAIKSLVAQDIVLVANGKEPKTVEVCKGYTDTDNRGNSLSDFREYYFTLLKSDLTKYGEFRGDSYGTWGI